MSSTDTHHPSPQTHPQTGHNRCVLAARSGTHRRYRLQLSIAPHTTGWSTGPLIQWHRHHVRCVSAEGIGSIVYVNRDGLLLDILILSMDLDSCVLRTYLYALAIVSLTVSLQCKYPVTNRFI